MERFVTRNPFVNQVFVVSGGAVSVMELLFPSQSLRKSGLCRLRRTVI